MPASSASSTHVLGPALANIPSLLFHEVMVLFFNFLKQAFRRAKMSSKCPSPPYGLENSTGWPSLINDRATPMVLLGTMEWEYDPSDVISVFSMSRQLSDTVLLARFGYLLTIWPSSCFTNSTSSFCPRRAFFVEKSFSDVTGDSGSARLCLRSLESRNAAFAGCRLYHCFGSVFRDFGVRRKSP